MSKAYSMTEREKQILWLAANRGVLSRIAAQLGTSRSAVSHVLAGRSTSALVGRALADAGAPGFGRKKKAA
jgi:hypothetical protein